MVTSRRDKETADRTRLRNRWPSLPDRSGQRIPSLLHRLNQTQWLSAKEIRGLQFFQLRAVVGYTLGNNPQYSRRLARAGIHVAQDMTPEAWKRVPVMTRDDLQQKEDSCQTRWHTFKRLDSSAARHERLPCWDDDMKGYQLGIGMSARSHLGHAEYRNHSKLKIYMDRIEAGMSPVEEVFELKDSDLKTQFIARSLGDGIALEFARHESVFGTSFLTDYAEEVDRLMRGGLVVVASDRVDLTLAGELLHDQVTLALYPPLARKWLLEKLEDYQVKES